LRRWLAKLPHPFTAKDREAGYRYDISILQAEFSLTQILDRPLSGRLLFEEIIRENLDTGLPTSASAPLCSLPGLMHVFTGPGLPKCCQTHPLATHNSNGTLRESRTKSTAACAKLAA
jgi:hypothetical protein